MNGEANSVEEMYNKMSIRERAELAKYLFKRIAEIRGIVPIPEFKVGTNTKLKATYAEFDRRVVLKTSVLKRGYWYLFAVLNHELDHVETWRKTDDFDKALEKNKEIDRKFKEALENL